MAALKESLVMSLSLLPENALVGLITYGTMVRSPHGPICKRVLMNPRPKSMKSAMRAAPSLMCSVAARTTPPKLSKICWD